MQSVTGNSDDNITSIDRPGESLVCINQANDGADDVDFPFDLNAGHLGGFSTDQRASNRSTGFSHSADNGFECVGV